MTKLFMFLFAWLSLSAYADISRQHVLDYFAASQQAVLTGDPEDIEKLVAFMADDIEDHHVSYGVQFSGKNFYRENLPAKAATVLSLDRQIRDMKIDGNIAVIDYAHSSTETGKDGQPVSYSGRTVLVTKFDANNQLKEIRRYVIADFQR